MRGRLLFRLFLGAALLGCLLNGWSPRPARAATVVTIDGKPFNYAEDRLLVYFDPVGKRETVIFSPAIRYRDDRFAWILPVTGDVKLSPASPQFFQRLDDYLTPTVIQEKAKIRAGSLIWAWLRPEPVLPPADPLAPGPGQIVVARRTATARGDIVVRATEKDLETALQPTLVLPPSEKPYNPKMREAAKQETAPLPKGFREWAAPYIKKNVSWVVATARTDSIERETGYDEQVAIPPFAVTFTTDAPVIPLVAPPPENPPDKSPKHRNYRVYVVTRERSDVFRDGKPMFPNEAVTFADRITLNDWKQKILAPTIPELTIAGDAFLTAFSFTERDQTAFTDNPEIRPSANQAILHPPVKIIIKEKPAIVPAEALLFILGGAILYFKQRKKE